VTDGERDAYHELSAYTLSHGGTAFIHQHVVDAFAAQRAEAGGKPVGLTFALAGLYLHVEHGVSGRDVQRIHMLMGRRKREWPRFALPADRGAMTAVDVMAAAPGPERDRAIEAWAACVWQAHAQNRPALVALLKEFDITF
jgi:uncharacterized protein DUF5946